MEWNVNIMLLSTVCFLQLHNVQTISCQLSTPALVTGNLSPMHAGCTSFWQEVQTRLHRALCICLDSDCSLHQPVWATNMNGSVQTCAVLQHSS